MFDFGTALYFAAIVAGALILGVTIAYAFLKFRSRTPADRRAQDQGTRQVYREEEQRRKDEVGSS